MKALEILKKLVDKKTGYTTQREKDEAMLFYREAIKELEALQNKTCDSCKHCPRLVSAINPFCIVHNYWLTEESSKILSCNRYEPKDK